MKKRWALWMVAVLLLCSLAACTDVAEPSGDSTTTTASTTTTTAAPADYTVFCGRYSDTETVEGPCYTVNIERVDNATKEIEFSLSYVGVNSSPLYTTETIRASITDESTAPFEWTDSWKNEGTGTLVLKPEDPSAVQLLVTVTKEAEVNRATLSTHDQYKTLTRREDEK